MQTNKRLRRVTLNKREARVFWKYITGRMKGGQFHKYTALWDEIKILADDIPGTKIVSVHVPSVVVTKHVADVIREGTNGTLKVKMLRQNF